MKEYVDIEKSYDYKTLADWYLNAPCRSGYYDIPMWSAEHIEELLNDFYVIPKDTSIADVVETKELNDLLYVIRTNMTSITRYVRHKRDKHPTLTEGQFTNQHLKYKELAESAVSNILKYINGKD